MVRALVLFSGGLDSRLAVKLLQEQNIEIVAVMFKLPFSGGCCNNELCSFRFSQVEGAKLEIIDCTKSKLFQEYLNIIKKPKHGTGTSINPCIDCRIFIIKQAKKLMKKFKCDFMATGEVLGERPMSQHKSALDIVEQEAGVEILRPLSAKLLKETSYEKNKLVNREKLLDIQGRSRKNQIQLAEKYNIKYPSPGGGCVLCEKEYAKKLKDLLMHTKDITPEHIILLKGFRHFRDKAKIILGKDHNENLVLEKINKKLKWNIIIPDNPGPTAIFENKQDKSTTEKLIAAYSSKDIKKRKKFEKLKI